MRILIVQSEALNFNLSKSWAFHSQIGWYKAALELGYDVDIYFTTFGFSLEDFLEGKEFYDISICNCILHLFSETEPLLSFHDFNMLRKKSIKLVGLTIEQTFYRDSLGHILEFSADRVNGAKLYLDRFDSIGVFYPPDMEFYKSYVKNLFTIGPTIPRKYLKKKSPRNWEILLRKFRKPVLMIAALYGERKNLYEKNKGFIHLGSIYDKDLSFRWFFVTRKMRKMTKFKESEAAIILNKFIQIKEEYFNRYLRLVRKHEFLLHPPAFFSGLHCRFIEAMAGKAICIHPLIIEEAVTLPIFNNIVFYESTEILNKKLKSLDLLRPNLKTEYHTEYTTEYDLVRIINLNS
jgi:hypothetical protein